MSGHRDLIWTFCCNAPKQYELILRDFVLNSGYVFYSGYCSNNLRDVLHAMWYLNGARHCTKLTPKQIYLLEDIRNVSQKHYAAYLDAQALQKN